MKFTVVGIGYVGLSLSILISQKYNVTSLDIDQKKINLINKKKSPFKDNEIENYLANGNLKLIATKDKRIAYKDPDYVIIATPTNYNSSSGTFDTSNVESVINDVISVNRNITIIIKSTVPFGFTEKMCHKFKTNNIYFSPEFLREGRALHDNLYPSRIIIGGTSKQAVRFGEVLSETCLLKSENIQLFYMKSIEAEAIKLFSNTYLAMRVSFFNELDSFAEVKNISSKNIIAGVSSDPRIGNYYNNPSFGYGGYCLPKDTKQLLEHYKDTPNEIIKSVIKSNITRKKFIADIILAKKPKSIGIYRLAMKMGSDNFRESAILDLIKLIDKKNIIIYLYEPLLKKSLFKNVILNNNFSNFIENSELIVANRLTKEIYKYRSKVYSRDLFQEN